MASKESIIAVPDPRLRRRSSRVGIVDAETRQIIADMKSATLDWEQERDSEVGVALAAVQIGIPTRIVVVRSQLDDKQATGFEVLINPEIVKHEGRQLTEPEGCLSVPDVYGLVPRHETVRVKALDENGRPFRLKAHGFLSRILQHEIDHLHGKLFVDKVKDDKFYKITENGQLKDLAQTQLDAARVLWNC